MFSDGAIGSAHADDPINNEILMPIINDRMSLLETIRIQSLDRSDRWVCSNNAATVVAKNT
jgi:hypothetical protein